MLKSLFSVTPVKTGVQNCLEERDSGLRRNDENSANDAFSATC